MLKKNDNNKNENKFGEKEISGDVVENLKEIEELDKEMEEVKEYSFKKDPSEVFKRKKLKHFVPGGKGEKRMMKALGGVKRIKSRQEKEFAQGLKKFADESVKVSTKPTTLKKITMLNYLKELKKEKHGLFKRSQIRKIRKTFFPGIKQRRILTRSKEGGADNSQTDTKKKFSVSRRIDKSFDNRGGRGRRL